MLVRFKTLCSVLSQANSHSSQRWFFLSKIWVRTTAFGHAEYLIQYCCVPFAISEMQHNIPWRISSMKDQFFHTQAHSYLWTRIFAQYFPVVSDLIPAENPTFQYSPWITREYCKIGTFKTVNTSLHTGTHFRSRSCATESSREPQCLWERRTLLSLSLLL